MTNIWVLEVLDVDGQWKIVRDNMKPKEKWILNINDIAFLSRMAAREAKKMWQDANPDDCFRVIKYCN